MEEEIWKTMPKKWITITFRVIYVGLFIGVIQLFFDEDYMNDHFGGFLLLVLAFFQSLERMISSLLNEEMRSILSDLAFVMIILALNVWSLLRYIAYY